MVKAKGRTGSNLLGYQGVEASTPPDLVFIPRAPTADDVYNFNVGTLWVNSTKLETIPPTIPDSQDIYILVRIVGTVADWVQFSTGILNTLTGDDGVIVDQDINENINVKGTTNRISVAGSIAGFNLTWDVGSSIALQFDTDSGSATISSNILNILGGTLLNTSGSSNTVTVNGDSDISLQFTTDSGNAIPVSNNLNVIGGAGISTSGAASTITVEKGGDIAEQYTADSGTAAPVAGNINIIGAGDVTTSGSGDTITVDLATFSQRSGFMYDISTSLLNTTGNAFNYKIPFDRVVFDLNNDYDPTYDTFVVPEDGTYVFMASIAYTNISTGMNAARIQIFANTPAFLFSGYNTTADPIATNAHELSINQTVTLELTAGDIIYVQAIIEGGSGNTVTIYSGGSPAQTWFCGYRIL